MSKYAAKHSGLSSDFLGAMIHALRIAEKQLSKSGSSVGESTASGSGPKGAPRRADKIRNPSSDKRTKRTCVKSSLGKAKSPKKDFVRKPTSVKEHDKPKLSVLEKKALRQELSKKTGFQSTNDSRNRVGRVPASLVGPNRGLLVRKNEAKASERALDVQKSSRVERRKMLRSVYSNLAKKQGSTVLNVEKLSEQDKSFLDRSRRNMKRKKTSACYASVLPATETGLLKRGGSVYSHYTWTVDSKGLPLKVKRDYGKAVKGLDLTKLGVKGSRVHVAAASEKKSRPVSNPVARALLHSEKKKNSLKEKIAFASGDAIENLVTRMSNLDRQEHKAILSEGGYKFDESDKARITVKTLKKGFAYGRRSVRRTAMFKAPRPIETSINVLSTEKWTLLDKEEYSRLRNICSWHSVYGIGYAAKTWDVVARKCVRKNKTWRDISDDLEKEVDITLARYKRDGLPEGIYPHGWAVYDKNLFYSKA
jgi:hypothetical protein